MPEYFTKQGLKKLKQELEYLKTVKEREITEALHKAAGFGDLSDNAAYTQAKEEQAFIRGRVLELEKLIANAKVIEKHKTNKIEIGSTVLVKYNNGEEKIMIVGPEEVDFDQGKISYQSPIGKALLGKTIADEVEVEAPAGKIKYKIIGIE